MRQGNNLSKQGWSRISNTSYLRRVTDGIIGRRKKFQVLRNMIMTCILLLSGLPKAAVVNQNRLLTALVVLSSNGVTANDVIYVNLPLYHTAGFIIGFIGSIETGKMT